MKPRICVVTDQVDWAFGFHTKGLQRFFPEYEFSCDTHPAKNAYDGLYCLHGTTWSRHYSPRQTILNLQSVLSYSKEFQMKPRIGIPTNGQDWSHGFHGKGLQKTFLEYDIDFEFNPVTKKYDGLYCMNCTSIPENYPKRKKILNLRSIIQYQYIRDSWGFGGLGLGYWLKKHFHKVYAVSHEIVLDLVQFRSDVRYLPSGIDADMFTPKEKPKSDKFLVGWAGTPRGCKQFPILIRAMQGLKDKGIDFRFKLYGTDKFEKWEDMPKFYQGLDAYINVSTTEGSNRCIFEAMACGVPVIATPVGEAPQNVLTGTTGLLIQLNGNNEANIKIIQQNVLLFREMMKYDGDRMREQARQFVLDHYDWKKVRPQYKEVFEDLINAN
jgi:glycosyltransferase involved in cell wall biosynthesis